MLAERKGSITVSALVGTGLVTLGVALTGVAGLSDDLRAATPSTTSPVLTPQDETAVPSTPTTTPTTPSAASTLDVDCPDHEQSRSRTTGGDGSPRET